MALVSNRTNRSWKNGMEYMVKGTRRCVGRNRGLGFLPWLCFLSLKISNISKSTLRGYGVVNVSISERIFLIEITCVCHSLWNNDFSWLGLLAVKCLCLPGCHLHWRSTAWECRGFCKWLEAANDFRFGKTYLKGMRYACFWPGKFCVREPLQQGRYIFIQLSFSRCVFSTCHHRLHQPPYFQRN